MTVCKEDQFERSGEANVKDWGAIGDGQADDTDALECAIAHVVSAPAGGVLYIPPGTFKINKRLDIETCKPFVIRGAAQDVSRLLWHECAEGEGIGIEPSGCVSKVVNDGHVSVERLSLICWSGKEPRSSGLLINGQKQLDPAQGKLCCRPVHRFKVSDVAITGRWLFGLVLRSAHLCALQNLNITGDDVTKGCRAAILMDGIGSPTGHTIECCRLYHFGIGIHLNSSRDKGRIEGVKVHGCNIVAVNRGIVADCVLELSVVQNHMNCWHACIDAIDCDQNFYMCNLLYERGDGPGIKISGTRPVGQAPSTAHCVNGNTIIAVKASKAMSGVEIDGNAHTATITNNTTVGGLHGVNSQQAEEEHHMLRNIYCSGNMMMGVKGEPYHVPRKGVTVDHSSDEQSA